MDSFDKIEAMLAELVEQVNSQKEQSGKVLKKLDGIDERLTRLESVEPPTGEQVSMITLKDHEEKMNEAVVVQTKWFTRYKEVKETERCSSGRASVLGNKGVAHQGIPLDSRQASLLDLDYLSPVYLDSLAVNL